MGPVNPTAGSWHEAHARFRLRERFWSKKIAFPSSSLDDSGPAAHATVNVSMSRPAAPAAMNRLRLRDIVSSVQLGARRPSMLAGSPVTMHGPGGRDMNRALSQPAETRVSAAWRAPRQYHSVRSTIRYPVPFGPVQLLTAGCGLVRTSRPKDWRRSTMDTRLGVLLWSQATSWSDFESAARRVDSLGYDHLWAWDHLYAIFGDPYQPIFEGYTTLAAWAKVTTRVRLGLLVGANTFRNPGLVAKTLTTLDHISDGRAIAGLGGAWFDLEHAAAGIDFGRGFGERLDWLDESVGSIRALLDGEAVTSPVGGRYALDAMRLLPPPVQTHLPILIGR